MNTTTSQQIIPKPILKATSLKMTCYKVEKGTLRQFIATLFALTVVSATSMAQGANRNSPGAVYAMTNEADGNRIAVFNRAADGTLAPPTYVPTGGLGSGTFENTAGGLSLTGQSPDNVGGGNQFLFATNPGDNTISSFRIKAHQELELADVDSSNGDGPISVTYRKKVLYVLNGGTSQGSGTPPNIAGFRVGAQGELTPIPNSIRPVTGSSASGVAQIGFNPRGDVLLVTERGDGAIIDSYTVDNDGSVTAGPIPNTAPSIMGPFGFTFTQRGQLLCTMNRGGAMGLGAASSFEVPSTGILVPISGPVNNFRSDTCWFVVTDNNRFGFVTNFQSGDLSSYRVEPNGALILLNSIAGVVGPPESGPADQALSNNSQYLYVRVISDGTIRAFRVDQSNGALTPLQTIGGLLPGASIGIAAK